MSQDQDAETVARLEALEDEPCETCEGIGEVQAINLPYADGDSVPCPACVSRELHGQIRSLSTRLAAAEAREAGLREKAASIGAGLDLLLMAVRADDPKAEIDLRVRDLAAEVAALQPEKPADTTDGEIK